MLCFLCFQEKILWVFLSGVGEGGGWGVTQPNPQRRWKWFEPDSVSGLVSAAIFAAIPL